MEPLPDEPDRAEFAAMIQKLLTKTSSGYKCGVTDVPPDYWAASARGSLRNRIMGGYPGTLFRQIRKFLRFRQLLL